MRVTFMRTGPRGPYRTEMSATHSVGGDMYLHPEGMLTITVYDPPGEGELVARGDVEAVPQKELPPNLPQGSIVVRPTAKAKAEGYGVGFVEAVMIHNRRHPCLKMKLIIRPSEY